MVLAHGDVDSRGITSWDQEVTADFFAGVVIEDFLCTAAEDYYVFARHGMSMDRDDRSRLNGIQHPLGFIIRGIPEVVVLA